MTVEPTPEQREIIGAETIGVLAVHRRSGAAQLTPVNYAYVDGKFLISITRDRAKYPNIKRNPNVSFLIVRPGWRPYVTVYGTAIIEEEGIATGTGEIARRMQPDRDLPDNFEEILRQQKRVLVILTPERFVP
jgi:PPOX class probable F420-dependent enzyme